MKEITLAHKVADNLLESKVNTLIKKNADIQGAFHLVKVKTVIILLFRVLVSLNISQPNFFPTNSNPKAY